VTQLWNSPAFERTLWGLAVIVGALIISFVAPPLIAVLRDARTALAATRARVGSWVKGVISSLWDKFWTARQYEPREPVLAGLGRIDQAARSLGSVQVAALRTLDQHLDGHVQLLRKAVAPQAPTAPDRERMTRVLSAGGVMKLLFLALIAIAVGLTNAALLNVFFREFLGTQSPVPTLFPALQIGHVIAALLFLLELSTGVLIYWFGPDTHSELDDFEVRTRTGAHRFYYVGAWGGLVFFALVELVAYAVLSDRLDIPQQLKISADNLLYPLMRYFFATFGLALTILLSALGHALAETFADRKRATVERRLLRAIERHDETIVKNVERVRTSLKAISELAAGFPSGVAQSFQDALQLDQPYPGAPVALYAATVRVLASTDPAASSSLSRPGFEPPLPPPIRNNAQIVGDLGVSLVLLAVLGIVSWLTAVEIVTWLRAAGNSVPAPMAWAAGLFVPAGAIALGVAARNALSRLRYATVVEQALTDPRGRRVFGLLVAAGGVGVCALLGALAYEIGVLGPGLLLNVLLGLTQGAVLVGLGGFLDSALVALAHATILLWTAAIQLFALLLQALAHLLSGVCLLAEYLLRLLAVPGDVIRSLRSGTRPPAQPLTTPGP
jgi:hypothetical protein